MYHELLAQIAATMEQQALQPPCTKEDAEGLARRAEDELGSAIPSEYLAFLRTTNGLVWNGLLFYATQRTPIAGISRGSVPGFVESNAEYRELRQPDPMEDFLIFGEDSVVFFTKNIPAHSFDVISIVGMNCHAAYGSFDELLVDALQGHV